MLAPRVPLVRDETGWLTSIRWIFKGSGMHVFRGFGLIVAYTAIVVTSVERADERSTTACPAAS